MGTQREIKVPPPAAFVWKEAGLAWRLPSNVEANTTIFHFFDQCPYIATGRNPPTAILDFSNSRVYRWSDSITAYTGPSLDAPS